MLLRSSTTPTEIERKPRKFRCSAHFPKVRRPIQKAFFRWYQDNATRFKVPLRFARRTDQCLEFTFPGLHPYLSISLTHEIGVNVIKRNVWWDALIFFEAYPERIGQEYQCSLCIPEAKENYATLNELWCDHLFEPFLEWVNDTLVPAHWLGIYGFIDEGATWARLLKSGRDNPENNPPTSVVPVWVSTEYLSQE